MADADRLAWKIEINPQELAEFTNFGELGKIDKICLTSRCVYFDGALCKGERGNLGSALATDFSDFDPKEGHRSFRIFRGETLPLLLWCGDDTKLHSIKSVGNRGHDIGHDREPEKKPTLEFKDSDGYVSLLFSLPTGNQNYLLPKLRLNKIPNNYANETIQLTVAIDSVEKTVALNIFNISQLVLAPDETPDTQQIVEHGKATDLGDFRYGDIRSFAVYLRGEGDSEDAKRYASIKHLLASNGRMLGKFSKPKQEYDSYSQEQLSERKGRPHRVFFCITEREENAISAEESLILGDDKFKDSLELSYFDFKATISFSIVKPSALYILPEGVGEQAIVDHSPSIQLDDHSIDKLCFLLQFASYAKASDSLLRLHPSQRHLLNINGLKLVVGEEKAADEINVDSPLERIKKSTDDAKDGFKLTAFLDDYPDIRCEVTACVPVLDYFAVFSGRCTVRDDKVVDNMGNEVNYISSSRQKGNKKTILGRGCRVPFTVARHFNNGCWELIGQDESLLVNEEPDRRIDSNRDAKTLNLSGTYLYAVGGEENGEASITVEYRVSNNNLDSANYCGPIDDNYQKGCELLFNVVDPIKIYLVDEKYHFNHAGNELLDKSNRPVREQDLEEYSQHPWIVHANTKVKFKIVALFKNGEFGEMGSEYVHFTSSDNNRVRVREFSGTSVGDNIDSSQDDNYYYLDCTIREKDDNDYVSDLVELTATYNLSSINICPCAQIRIGVAQLRELFIVPEHFIINPNAPIDCNALRERCQSPKRVLPGEELDCTLVGDYELGGEENEEYRRLGLVYPEEVEFEILKPGEEQSRILAHNESWFYGQKGHFLLPADISKLTVTEKTKGSDEQKAASNGTSSEETVTTSMSFEFDTNSAIHYYLLPEDFDERDVEKLVKNNDDPVFHIQITVGERYYPTILAAQPPTENPDDEIEFRLSRNSRVSLLLDDKYLAGDDYGTQSFLAIRETEEQESASVKIIERGGRFSENHCHGKLVVYVYKASVNQKNWRQGGYSESADAFENFI